MNINEARAEIDRIDCEIVSLLVQRFAAVDIIGEEKKNRGLAVRDGGRESEVIGHVADCAGTESDDVVKIYKEIIAVCRQRQNGG